MLRVDEDVVHVYVFCDVAENYMFHNLAADTGKRNWTIVAWL